MLYRVYVPASYDPSKAYPSAVILHGGGEDENSFVGRANSPLRAIAERRGDIEAREIRVKKL